MLPNTLNTNEIKNAAGAECEFQHLQQVDRTRIFGLITEAPYLPYRLKIAHREIGLGIKRRRQSAIRFDKSVVSTVDNLTIASVVAQLTIDAPVGALIATTEMANVLANILSFCATTGAGTTVLFDCTGNGAAALLNGGI